MPKIEISNVSKAYMDQIRKVKQQIGYEVDGSLPPDSDHPMDVVRRIPLLPNQYLYVNYTPTSHTIYVSDSVKQVLGYEPDEFVYLKQIDITHADDKPIVMAALAYYYSHVGRVRYEPFSAAIHFQHRVIHKSGEVRSIMRSSIPIAYGLDDKMTYHVSIATDITEMKPSNRVRIWQDGLSDDIKPFPTETFYENQSLTKREMDILFYVCQGFTSADIAMRLHISRHTVDTHRRRILSKLHLQNTTQLIKAAHENEWFPTRSEPTKRDPDAANEMESGSDDGFGSGIDPNMRG